MTENVGEQNSRTNMINALNKQSAQDRIYLYVLFLTYL